VQLKCTYKVKACIQYREHAWIYSTQNKVTYLYFLTKCDLFECRNKNV